MLPSKNNIRGRAQRWVTQTYNPPPHPQDNSSGPTNDADLKPNLDPIEKINVCVQVKVSGADPLIRRSADLSRECRLSNNHLRSGPFEMHRALPGKQSTAGGTDKTLRSSGTVSSSFQSVQEVTETLTSC